MCYGVGLGERLEPPRHRRVSGAFDPDSLEAVLDSYAEEGWRVVEGILASNAMKSLRAEIVVILERTKT